MREAIRILNELLDRYENSKTFTGSNKVSQKIFIKPDKLFPDYADDSNFEIFDRVNQAAYELQRKELVDIISQRNGVIQKLVLNLDKLEDAYKICGRSSKKDIFIQIKEIWNKTADETDKADPFYPMLAAYIARQAENMSRNRQIAFFDGSINEYEALLRAIHEIVCNEKEQYIRDFSVQLFGDSKKLGLLEEKIRTFLFEYGESDDRETAIEEYGIVKTPSYVSIKGEAVISIAGQRLDLSKLRGDISLSTVTLEQIEDIEIAAQKVVTIENLTSFHSFCRKGFFAIYLGGYHNKLKRQFLRKIYEGNTDKEYYHFGDIDAGGFYIYEHLIRKTGIPFKLLCMDIACLKEHQAAWRELSSGDRNRIKALLNKPESEGYREVLLYMLENNCKLEQEAVSMQA